VQYTPRNFINGYTYDYQKNNNDSVSNMDNKINFIKNRICDGQKIKITYRMFQDYLDKYYNDDTQVLIERIIAFHENSYKQKYDEIDSTDIENLIKMDSNYSFQILAMIGFEIIKREIIDMYYFAEKNMDYRCCIYNKKLKIIYQAS
jgi:hypothetical protein